MRAFNFGSSRGLQCFSVARKFDDECRSPSGFAAYADVTSMIAHDRLHDRQPQTGSMLLARVIRREYALALFGRQA